MNLIIFVTLLAFSSAAELPSNYLPPQNLGPQHPPSSSYLPSNQSPSHTIAITGQQGSSHGQGSGGDTGNRRPQQDAEKNAVILNQEQEITENGFHYAYETSNGIRAEEGGDSSQSQGGFSYKGDDGQTYTVIFSAGEGGFRPQGDHLPEPPPTPQEILLALEQNARDEAAGIFDDGLYHPEVHGGPQNGGHPGSSQGYGTGSQTSSSSGQGFGGANHQGSFNSNAGYNY